MFRAVSSFEDTFPESAGERVLVAAKKMLVTGRKMLVNSETMSLNSRTMIVTFRATSACSGRLIVESGGPIVPSGRALDSEKAMPKKRRACAFERHDMASPRRITCFNREFASAPVVMTIVPRGASRVIESRMPLHSRASVVAAGTMLVNCRTISCADRLMLVAPDMKEIECRKWHSPRFYRSLSGRRSGGVPERVRLITAEWRPITARKKGRKGASYGPDRSQETGDGRARARFQ